MKVKLISHTNNPEKTVALAGKLCYAGCTIDELEEKLTEEEIKKFVKKIMDLGHESVLEHISFTFAIEGISRSLSHQLVRHRIASYSQQSQRYVDSGNANFVVPDDIKNNSIIYELFSQITNDDRNNYNKLVEALLYNYCYNFLSSIYGEDLLAKTIIEIIELMENTDKKQYNIFKKKSYENARAILPNATETKIIVTMNLRSLINFFDHRCCNRAQQEIRSLANEMLKICKKNFPLLFNNLGAPCKRLGYCPEGNMQCEIMKGRIPTLQDLKQSWNKINKFNQ